jgi:aerobic-type carbon monoxide dehydrogenase small subunit (CoxS/CutS family)
MTAPKYLFTDDNSEALDELEKTQEEFQIFLNDLYTRYPIPSINEETGQPYTEEEKINYLIKNHSVNPSVWFQQSQLKKQQEEERKAAAFTPLGMAREIIVDGEVVNTYDFLVETMGFEPYTKGSALNILDGLSSVNELKNLQQQLKDAGYLQAGTYNPGFVNTATTQAVERLLGDSNNSGKKWNAYLIDVLINPKFDTSDLPSEPDLDYNQLGNTVVNTVKSEIGRDPTKEEYDILLGILAGYETEEFEQTVSSLAPKYKKQTTTLEPGYNPVTGEMEIGGEVETGGIEKIDSDVKIEDAGAKFQAKVREMFKPTKDLNQRREQSKNVVNLINRSVAGLGSIGG